MTNGTFATYQSVFDLESFEIKELDTHVVRVARLDSPFLYVGSKNSWLRPKPNFSCILEIEVVQVGATKVTRLHSGDYLLSIFVPRSSVDSRLALERIEPLPEPPDPPDGYDD